MVESAGFTVQVLACRVEVAGWRVEDSGRRVGIASQLLGGGFPTPEAVVGSASRIHNAPRPPLACPLRSGCPGHLAAAAPDLFPP